MSIPIRHISGLPVQPYVAFGRVVREHRERNGMTQGDLAGCAKIDEAVVRVVEEGLCDPSVRTMWALSGALGISFSQLAAEVQYAVGTVAERGQREA